MKGILLFAHGSRDPDWARPVQTLAARLQAQLPQVSVAIAYLELMAPSLQESAQQLIDEGAADILVVPVFLSQGSHVRRDLPQLVDACRAVHPGVEIRCATAVGEDDGVLDAIARYCIDQIGDGA